MHWAPQSLRQADHAGQIAILLADDGLPAAWAEAFAYDAFVVLPLRARLSCGVGVSSRFEVQSGRTHLVDPTANAQRFEEVAALLRRMPAALKMCTTAGSTHPEMFRRFWCIWRWQGGDHETERLRRNLAKALAALPETDTVVPTSDGASCISLSVTPAFYFQGVPEKVRAALLATGIPLKHADGRPRVLAPKNTVPDDFAMAYLQTCRYASVVPAIKVLAPNRSKLACRLLDRTRATVEESVPSAQRAQPASSFGSICIVSLFSVVVLFEWISGCPRFGSFPIGEPFSLRRCNLPFSSETFCPM